MERVCPWQKLAFSCASDFDPRDIPNARIHFFSHSRVLLLV